MEKKKKEGDLRRESVQVYDSLIEGAYVVETMACRVAEDVYSLAQTK